MDKIIVTIIGIAGITGIYWFFFGNKSGKDGSGSSGEVRGNWSIMVEGGYKPAAIYIPIGKTSTITFTRKDPNSCLEEIVLPDFKIKKFLPVGKPVAISVSPTKPGSYDMHCGMNMFHGRIIVV